MDRRATPPTVKFFRLRFLSWIFSVAVLSAVLPPHLGSANPIEPPSVRPPPSTPNLTPSNLYPPTLPPAVTEVPPASTAPTRAARWVQWSLETLLRHGVPLGIVMFLSECVIEPSLALWALSEMDWKTLLVPFIVGHGGDLIVYPILYGLLEGAPHGLSAIRLTARHGGVLTYIDHLRRQRLNLPVDRTIALLETTAFDYPLVVIDRPLWLRGLQPRFFAQTESIDSKQTIPPRPWITVSELEQLWIRAHESAGKGGKSSLRHLRADPAHENNRPQYAARLITDIFDTPTGPQQLRSVLGPRGLDRTSVWIDLYEPLDIKAALDATTPEAFAAAIGDRPSDIVAQELLWHFQQKRFTFLQDGLEFHSSRPLKKWNLATVRLYARLVWELWTADLELSYEPWMGRRLNLRFWTNSPSGNTRDPASRGGADALFADIQALKLRFERLRQLSNSDSPVSGCSVLLQNP